MISIGGITLTGIESPEKVPFAGKHTLAVHKLVGGSRVIDAMGPDDEDIAISGRFQGPGAASKARAIDGMREAGTVVSLIWGSFSRQVIVSQFTPSYEKEFQIPFSLSCTVISSGSVSFSLVPGLDEAISGDLSTLASVF
jgi:hypothetical protein